MPTDPPFRDAREAIEAALAVLEEHRASAEGEILQKRSCAVGREEAIHTAREAVARLRSRCVQPAHSPAAVDVEADAELVRRIDAMLRQWPEGFTMAPLLRDLRARLAPKPEPGR